MKAFDASVRYEQHFTGLNPCSSVKGNNVRLNDYELSSFERLIRQLSIGSAFGAENWRKVSSPIAVQNVIDGREASFFYHARCINHIRRSSARPQNRDDGVKCSVRRCVEITVKRIWLFCYGKAAKNLSGMVEERRADL
jgi:hypothetical protein